MPKQDLDNELRADLSVQASLEQRRSEITSALKDMPAKQSKEQQYVESEQKNAVGNSALAGDPKVAEILADQRNQLAANQKNQVELINQALTAASRFEKIGPDGASQGLQLINATAELNGSVAEATKEQRSAELQALRNISSIRDATTRNEEIGDLFKTHKDTADLLERDVAVARATLERRESLAQNTLDRDQRDRLLAATKAAVASDTLEKILTADTMQRLANEALHPGKERLETPNKENTVQRVKGELAERLAVTEALKEIENENKTRATDRRLFLIEGDRIRDEKSNKMSDGLIMWRNAENKLQIWKALEVKGGPAAARELNYKIEKLTEKQEQELRKLARDVALDATPKILSPALLKSEIERQTKEQETYLRSREAQKEAGQRQQTTERLDLTERIYIDGRAYRASVDRERRLDDIVQKVATADALKKDPEVEHLGVSSKELQRVAEAFVEELLREQKMA